MIHRGLFLVIALALFGCSSEDDSGAGGAGSVSHGSGGTGGAATVGPGGGGSGPVEPVMLFEQRGIGPEQVAIVINDQDPLSIEIGTYYRAARDIPEENVVTLSFGTDAVLPVVDFEAAAATLEAALPQGIQALALTFDTPFRVGCMSVTSAFALGFDDAYCNTTGGACGPTASVSYYDSSSSRPWDDHGIRPTMSIAATSFEDAKALIDRGVASDGTFPTGDGYLVRTTDSARSVRWPVFVQTETTWTEALSMTYVDNSDGSGSNVIADTSDVLFYFTGLANVPDVATNDYVPGAVADHLTSFGGRMPDAGGQMSIMRWLEAGATGSYGTTVEPCNYTQKFPNTSVMLPHYFGGETLVESYTKSVLWPGEGVFAGEPLARPWGSTWERGPDGITYRTTLLTPAVPFEIVAGPTEDGPWTTVEGPIVLDAPAIYEGVISPATEAFYLLRRVP